MIVVVGTCCAMVLAGWRGDAVHRRQLAGRAVADPRRRSTDSLPPPVRRAAVQPCARAGSIRSCSPRPRPRSTSTRSPPATGSAWSISTRPSNEERFHVVDLRSGEVESFRVAHGSGSDPEHSGFLERFSNDFGSYASSNGAYTTGEYYHGKYGLSMKTHGRDWSNYNAEPRAIVIHNAWYAEPDMLAAARQARPQPGLLRLQPRRPVEGDAQARRRPA